MATTTNLNSLVINYLTQAQYDSAVSGGTIDANQLYLTPDSTTSNYLEKSYTNDTFSGAIGWNTADSNSVLEVYCDDSNSNYFSDTFFSTDLIEFGITKKNTSQWTGIGIGSGSMAFTVDNNMIQLPSSAGTLALTSDLPRVQILYGTCSTTASTAAKVVSCASFDQVKNSIIGILFSTANTAATPTLNVNSAGAKSIYVGSATPTATDNVLKWSANTMVYFLFDGTYFRYITSVSAGSVVPSRGANTWYGTSSTSASTQAKTSTIDNFVLTKGALVSITFSTANTYTSAKITLNINSTGAKDIYYNNAVTSSSNTLLWGAGDTLTFMYNGTGYYYIGSSSLDASRLTGTIPTSCLPVYTGGVS